MRIDLQQRPAIGLYQPDIPQNVGAIMRLCAAMALELHIIEPCGFALGDARLRRAGLDYAARTCLQRHDDWAAFCRWRLNSQRRLVLATTKASQTLHQMHFTRHDLLLFGRESAGVPESVHSAADAGVRIPMLSDARSLNLAQSVAMISGEALRQCGGFAPLT